MCFSATASFTAGTLLTITGVASIVKSPHRSQLIFAAIPLLFGIQQIAEGILWITLPNPQYLNIQKIFTYIFLFFAQILWPIWVPIAFFLLERNTKRKNMQKIPILAGFVVALYLLYCLLNYNVSAKIEQKHIAYIQDYPSVFRVYGFVFYGFSTIFPPFLSHFRRMWIFGIAVIISYVVSAIFYEHYVFSVWCFFASIISVITYLIILKLGREEQRRLSAVSDI